MIIKFIILFIIAYLLGSISSAILVCKFLGLPDPRNEGSKNPGATNVMRFGGKQAAILTLLGDVLKGVIAVVLARLFGLQGIWLGWIAVAAFLGHLYPIFFQFKGGKGVATALGVTLALSPAVGIVAAITWLLVLVFSRYSSLAAIVTAIFTPIYSVMFKGFDYFLPLLVMTIFLIWRHRQNIKRLREGTEPKVNF